MSTREPIYFSHADSWPLQTVSRVTAGSSGTYQSTGSAVGKLHAIKSAIPIFVEGGTGASVDASAGYFVAANEELRFRPRPGRESLGYQSVSGTFSATDIATVALLEKS